MLMSLTVNLQADVQRETRVMETLYFLNGCRMSCMPRRRRCRITAASSPACPLCSSPQGRPVPVLGCRGSCGKHNTYTCRKCERSTAISETWLRRVAAKPTHEKVQAAHKQIYRAIQRDTVREKEKIVQALERLLEK